MAEWIPFPSLEMSMKLAFTTLVCPQWSLQRILSTALVYGYSGIEVRCDGLQDHGIEVTTDDRTLASIVERMEKAEIEIVCLATSLQLSSDHFVGLMQERIRLAAAIGAPGIRVLGGELPPGESLDLAAEHLGQKLREATFMASDAGVEVWVETHDTLAKVRDASSVLSVVDHPSVGLLYDNLHPARMGEPLDESFAYLGDHLRYVHLHDGVNTPEYTVVKPFGEGDMPMAETLRRLKQIGYDGYLGGEWFKDQYGDDVEDAIERYAQDVKGLALQVGVKID